MSARKPSSDPHAGADAEEVLVTSADVTSIGDGVSGEVAVGRSELAASLTRDPDVLNMAFVTGAGDVQFIQIDVDDLVSPGARASEWDVVVKAELTALSGDAISGGGGAAIPIGTVSVAAHLSEQGDLSLSFVDGDERLQLIETNVAQLLHGRCAVEPDVP